MFTNYFTQLDLKSHECERRNDYDELKVVVPGTTWRSRLVRWLWQRCLISERNYRSYKYMRSKSAINYERSRQIRQYHWMIHPFSEFRIGYELIMILIYILTLFYRPVVVLYEYEMERKNNIQSFSDGFIFMTDILSLLGVIIGFRTGHLVSNTKEVYLSPNYAATYYLKGYFILDVVTAIPYHAIESLFGNTDKYVGILVDCVSLTRFLRVFPLFKFYDNAMEVFGMNYVTYKMCRLVFLTAMYLHWTASVHFLVAKMVQFKPCHEIDSGSWIKHLCETNETEDGRIYLESMFRSFSNTFRTGHGQTPVSTAEDMLVTICVMIGGNVLTAWATVTIMNLVNNDHASRTKYFKMTTQLGGYMQHMKFLPKLQQRIISYYDFRFHKTFYREDEIMASVTSELRQGIMLHNCQRLVENVSFFYNLPMTMMVRIVSHLRSECYLPNDVIIKYGSVGDSMYFIKSGTVAIYTEDGIEICHLEDGAHFGEIALVMPGDRRVATVVAVENSLLYRLDKEDFLRAIAPFPDLLARIKHVARDRLMRTEEMASNRDSRSMSLTSRNVTASLRSLGPPVTKSKIDSTSRRSML